jgi:hypothetical protein
MAFDCSCECYTLCSIVRSYVNVTSCVQLFTRCSMEAREREFDKNIKSSQIVYVNVTYLFVCLCECYTLCSMFNCLCKCYTLFYMEERERERV